MTKQEMLEKLNRLSSLEESIDTCFHAVVEIIDSREFREAALTEMGDGIVRNDMHDSYDTLSESLNYLINRLEEKINESN